MMRFAVFYLQISSFVFTAASNSPDAIGKRKWKGRNCDTFKQQGRSKGHCDITCTHDNLAPCSVLYFLTRLHLCGDF